MIKKAYIYIIQSKGAVIYVGATSSPNTRFKQHINSTLKKWDKDHLVFEIIEECTLKKIKEREVYWIDYYKKINASLLNKISSGYGVKELPIPKEAMKVDAKTLLKVKKHIKNTRQTIGGFYDLAVQEKIYREAPAKLTMFERVINQQQ
jgi:hypothetical protein